MANSAPPGWRQLADGTWARDESSQTALNWVQDRAGENSTWAGMAGGVAAAPTLAHHAIAAAAAAATGDYGLAIAHAIPVIAGLALSVGAIIHKETPPNEQVKNALASLSDSDKRKLLSDFSTAHSGLPTSASADTVANPSAVPVATK